MVDKKIQNYYWIIGVVSITAIVFILALIFILVPSVKSVNKTNAELKDKKNELNLAEQKLGKLKKLKVKEDEIKEQSRVVYRAIPTKKEVGDIFIELNDLEEQAGGISLKKSGSTSAAPSATTGSEGQVPTGINALEYASEVTLPSYQDFKTLLENSEEALRFVHLKNFKISNDQGFTVTLVYKAYYRGEAK